MEQHFTPIRQFLEPLTGPLGEGQLVNLAHQIHEIHANRNLRAFLEEVWGHMEQIDTIALSSVERMGSEEMSSIDVWDEQSQLLLPDFSLPFWKTALEQVRDDAAVNLGQDLEECDSNAGRLEAINQYLCSQGVFKEMGLPDPKDESPFYQHRTRLPSVPMTYPALYREQRDRVHQGQRGPGEMREYEWPSGLDAGIRVGKAYAHDLQEIYNRWSEFPANIVYRVARYIASVKETKITLQPEGHVCYLWKRRANGGRGQQERYLIELEFRDELLLLRLFVPAETIPLERVNLYGTDPIDIPVHRVDAPLPDHPAAAWFMKVVRALETPPLLAMTAQVSQEIASEWIWSVCEELADGLAKIAEATGDSFPRPLAELEARHVRLGERLKKMTASTEMTRLNMQAEIVCLAAQILLQRFAPEDDLQMPWMILLNAFGQTDHATPILAARAKVAFLVAHPELARLPNDMGFSLRGPMHAVGMAIREAIRRGVYK